MFTVGMTMAVSVVVIVHVIVIVAVCMGPSSRHQRRSLPCYLGFARRGRALEGDVPRGTTTIITV